MSTQLRHRKGATKSGTPLQIFSPSGENGPLGKAFTQVFGLREGNENLEVAPRQAVAQAPDLERTLDQIKIAHAVQDAELAQAAKDAKVAAATKAVEAELEELGVGEEEENTGAGIGVHLLRPAGNAPALTQDELQQRLSALRAPGAKSEAATALEKRLEALTGRKAKPVNINALQRQLNEARGDMGGLRRRAVAAAEGAQAAAEEVRQEVKTEAAALKAQIEALKDGLRGDVANQEQTAQIIATLAALQQQIAQVQTRQEEHIGMTQRIQAGVEAVAGMSRSLLIGQADLKELAKQNLDISKSIRAQVQRIHDRDFKGFIDGVLYNEWAFLALYMVVNPLAPVTTQVLSTLWGANLAYRRLTQEFFNDINDLKNSVKFGALGVGVLYFTHPWKALAYLGFMNAKYLGLWAAGDALYSQMFPGYIENAVVAAGQGAWSAVHDSAGQFDIKLAITSAKAGLGKGVGAARNLIPGMSRAAFTATLEAADGIWELLKFVFGNPALACHYIYDFFTTGRAVVTIKGVALYIVNIPGLSGVKSEVKNIVLAEKAIIVLVLKFLKELIRQVLKWSWCQLPAGMVRRWFMDDAECKKYQGGGSKSRSRKNTSRKNAIEEINIRSGSKASNDGYWASQFIQARAVMGMQLMNVVFAQQMMPGMIPDSLVQFHAMNYAIIVGITTSTTYMGAYALEPMPVHHTSASELKLLEPPPAPAAASRSRNRTRKNKAKRD